MKSDLTYWNHCTTNIFCDNTIKSYTDTDLDSCTINLPYLVCTRLTNTNNNETSRLVINVLYSCRTIKYVSLTQYHTYLIISSDLFQWDGVDSCDAYFQNECLDSPAFLEIMTEPRKFSVIFLWLAQTHRLIPLPCRVAHFASNTLIHRNTNTKIHIQTQVNALKQKTSFSVLS